MDFLKGHKSALIDQSSALPGRTTPLSLGGTHEVLGTPLTGTFPAGLAEAFFGMGCFWGAERLFWQLPGVFVTGVGYAGGYTENPTYAEVCSGRTGHAEVVRVVFDPAKISYADLLRTFFEEHDPTQLMRQGNDVGTQYRSAIYAVGEDELNVAKTTAESYSKRLVASGYGEVVTEIIEVGELHSTMPFYFAEDYHQQYLAKNPNGYCGLAGTGVSCQIGLLHD
jgi:peptide-methionine (S)-S-oxide reductase